MEKVEAPPRETSSASVHLDALRGSAALLVFANHTRALYFASPIPKPEVSEQVSQEVQASVPDTESAGSIRIASAAVIVFFVLSGYLVGGSVIRSLRSGSWSWRNYLAKRMVRLLIVLLPALFVGFILDYTGSHVFGAGSIYTAPPGLHLNVAADLGKRLRPLVLLGNALFLQTIVVPVEGTNASLWSLANEFWYYLIFPLASCAVFSQFGLLWRGIALLCAGTILWFVGFHIAILFPIWLMGAAVSLLPRRMSPLQSRMSTWFALAGLVASIAVVRILDMNSVIAEYIIAVFTALLLYCILGQSWTWHDGPSLAGAKVYRQTSRFFSDISYSLYLFHLPLAVFLCAAVNSPWRSYRESTSTLAWYVASDCIVLGVVYLLWILFEARTDAVRKRLFGIRSSTHGSSASAQVVRP